MAITSREELAELIANVELERQTAARDTGNAAACLSALRKLQNLQAREKTALSTKGPSAVHSANLAALAAEVSRVQKLAGTTNRLSLPNRSGDDERSGARRGASRPPLRSRGRTTGSNGGGR
jgi:hypothetical protein